MEKTVCIISKSIFDIIAIDTDNCNSTGNHRYRCIIMLNIQKCNVVDSITMETLDNRITSKLLKISIVKICGFQGGLLRRNAGGVNAA